MALFLYSALAARTDARSTNADLSIGRAAPQFALPDETGKVQRLADYRGRTVIVMFYPRDFTPG